MKKRILLLLTFLAAMGIHYYNNEQAKKVNVDVSLPLTSLMGKTMGTSYMARFDANIQLPNLQKEIDSLLMHCENVFSHYNTGSELSIINISATGGFLSPHMLLVLNRANEIYELTQGAFDPSIAPLVDRWGFGPLKYNNLPDTTEVDSLLRLVGFNQWSIVNDSIVKALPKAYLNLSAIAKGYVVDELGRFLESKGIQNYMVEIGGEVVCKGTKPDGSVWRIGINNPVEQGIKTIAKIKDLALATSGNYLNYYEKDGKKYAHTISPFTGRFVEHQLLSVSVLAKTCMDADAFATAFMVMGMEKSKKIVDELNDLEVHFIYEEAGVLKTWSSQGFQNKLTVQ